MADQQEERTKKLEVRKQGLLVAFLEEGERVEAKQKRVLMRLRES